MTSKSVDMRSAMPPAGAAESITRVFVRTAAQEQVPPAFRQGLVVDWFENPDRSTLSETVDRLFSLAGRPSRPAHDLLVLGTAVYVADKKTSRRRTPDRWTRTFELAVPVCERSQWEATKDRLEGALGFLTGDHWALRWREAVEEVMPTRPTFSATGGVATERYAAATAPFDAVCLFSGGLDSLAGAIDVLEAPERTRLLLIGHHENPLTAHLQRELTSALAAHYGNDRVRVISVLVRPAKPQAGQEYPLPETFERTMRSRSLLFVALGLAAASALDPSATLYVPENGFIALNVPLIIARLGSLSTRTTHPHFLAELHDALAMAGVPNPIVNPFRGRTKGEVLASSRNPKLLYQLARTTISCAHPEVGRYERTGYGNCGYCFPCLIRRASMHVVGWDDPSDYGRDVCADTNLVGGHSERARDVRAVLTALYAASSASHDHRLAPLRAGPLDGVAVRELARVHQQGVAEVKRLFADKACPEVRRLTGL